jgi:chromosome segregation ATPase
MSDLDSDPDRLEVAVVLSELGNIPSGSNDIWAGSRGCKRLATSALNSPPSTMPTKKVKSTLSADEQLAEAKAAVVALRVDKEQLQGIVATLLEQVQFLVRERAALEQRRTMERAATEQLRMVQNVAAEQRRMDQLSASEQLGMIQQTLLDLDARANSYKHQNDELQNEVAALSSSEQAKEIQRLNTELDKLKSKYDTISSSAASKPNNPV